MSGIGSFVNWKGVGKKFKKTKKTVSTKKKRSASTSTKRIPPTPTLAPQKQCALSVYWLSVEGEDVLKQYDWILYFGISPKLNGKIALDQGYRNLSKFVSQKKEKQAGLVIRMVDKRLSERFLNKEGQVWEKFFSEVVSLAKEKGFSEIALDLELYPLQQNLKEKVTQFVNLGSLKAKEAGLNFSFIAYADSFYAKRPFDFAKISSLVDRVYLMAYDFTKPISEPGPGFPLFKGEKWAYSLSQAVDDFLKFFPAEKIVVVFGMYGYDWLVNEKKIPLKKASALTLNQIRKKYLSICTPDKCLVRVDPVAKEKEIDIVFSKLTKEKAIMYPHIIWFEDEETVKLKKEELVKKGLFNFCFFALGYY